MTTDTIIHLPLFQGLDPTHLNLLTRQFQSEKFSEGSVVFEQGTKADKLYILQSGRVQIRFKPEDGDILNVAEIEEGGVFGWSAALGRRIYTSGAVSLLASEVLSVKGEDLQALCGKYPETGVIILERLAEVIAQRLQNTHSHVVGMLRKGVGAEIEND